MTTFITPSFRIADAYPHSGNILYLPRKVIVEDPPLSFSKGQVGYDTLRVRTEYEACAVPSTEVFPHPVSWAVPAGFIMNAAVAPAGRQMYHPLALDCPHTTQTPYQENGLFLPMNDGSDMLQDQEDAELATDSDSYEVTAADDSGRGSVLSTQDGDNTAETEIARESASESHEVTAADDCGGVSVLPTQDGGNTEETKSVKKRSGSRKPCQQGRKSGGIKTRRDKEKKQGAHRRKKEERKISCLCRERKERKEKLRRQEEERQRQIANREAVTEMEPAILDWIVAEMPSDEIEGALNAYEEALLETKHDRKKYSDEFAAFKGIILDHLKAMQDKAREEKKNMDVLAYETKYALARTIHETVVGGMEPESRAAWEKIRAFHCETNSCYLQNSDKLVSIPRGNCQENTAGSTEDTVPWHRTPHSPCIPAELIRPRDPHYFKDLCPTLADAAGFVEYVFSVYEMVCDIVFRYRFLFVDRPGRDFTRTRLLSFPVMIHYTMQQGGGSILQEIADFFGFSPKMPSPSAVTQARKKIKASCLRFIFQLVNNVVFVSGVLDSTWKGMVPYIIDGSILNVPPNPEETETRKTEHCNQITMHCLYNPNDGYYMDAEVGTTKEMDEREAFIRILERNSLIRGFGLFLADRGYPSWLLLATMLENKCHFLFRIKDAESEKSSMERFYPELERFMEANGITDGEVDTTIVARIVKSHRGEFASPQYIYVKDFPYCESADDCYTAQFRVIRKRLSSGEYELLITNISEDFMTADEAYELYHWRWKIEESYLRLKWRAGMVYLHHETRNLYEQEIWGTLTQFNISSTITEFLSRTAEYSRRVAAMQIELLLVGANVDIPDEYAGIADEMTVEEMVALEMVGELKHSDDFAKAFEEKENAKDGKSSADDTKKDDKPRKYCTNFNLAQLMIRYAIAEIGKQYLTVAPASSLMELVETLMRFSNETERIRGPFSRDGKRSLPFQNFVMRHK